MADRNKMIEPDHIDKTDPNFSETRSSGVNVLCSGCNRYLYDRDFHLKKCPLCGESL